jgi:hypothetical protein
MHGKTLSAGARPEAPIERRHFKATFANSFVSSPKNEKVVNDKALGVRKRLPKSLTTNSWTSEFRDTVSHGRRSQQWRRKKEVMERRQNGWKRSQTKDSRRVVLKSKTTRALLNVLKTIRRIKSQFSWFDNANLIQRWRWTFPWWPALVRIKLKTIKLGILGRTDHRCANEKKKKVDFSVYTLSSCLNSFDRKNVKNQKKSEIG